MTVSTYHHGDLPSALRAATVELIAEKGTSGFSLRQVARQAGVSHAAPAHHFGDVEGLLTSVAAEGYGVLADEMAAAIVDVEGARERLLAAGTAYVRVALQNPGHFAVMLQQDIVNRNDAELSAQGVRAYQILADCVETVRQQLNPELDVDKAATFCWATVQGLVTLADKLQTVADDTETTYTEATELVAPIVNFMFEGLAAR